VVTVRTPTSTTGTKSGGFTLIEIVAAVTVVGLVLALAVPQSIRFYESVQFRASVREVITLLNAARYAAVAKGTAQDVVISPREKWVLFGDERVQFGEGVNVAAHSAKEVNRDGLGVIRFYHDGGASGGGIDISRNEAPVVKIAVDWLVGRVDVDFGQRDG
jgi:general secretion pathway protein H